MYYLLKKIPETWVLHLSVSAAGSYASNPDLCIVSPCFAATVKLIVIATIKVPRPMYQQVQFF